MHARQAKPDEKGEKVAQFFTLFSAGFVRQEIRLFWVAGVEEREAIAVQGGCICEWESSLSPRIHVRHTSSAEEKATSCLRVPESNEGTVNASNRTSFTGPRP